MRNSKILSTANISLMTVIIILCGWITLPAPVPFTMQTFGIYAAVLILGSKDALISVAMYILLGLAGVPVFSGFASGLGHLLSPTGGYILGFLLCPLVSLLGEKLCRKKPQTLLLLSAGTLLCYASGTLWFMAYTNQADSLAGLWSALLTCVLPYLVPDALKLFAAYFLAKKLKPKLRKLNKE